MLRGLLREGGDAKALLEKLGLFNDPERLEKYVVASEVTVEVLDLFFARILGDQKAPIDLGAVRDHLGGLFVRDQEGCANETLSEGVDDRDSVMERMQGKVADLERQLSAVQRQLKMQGDVSEIAVSVNDRLDKVEARSEKQMEETGRELLDVKSEVELLKKEMGSRASAGDVSALLREVSSLRKAERRLDGQIVRVEEKIREDNKTLRKEIQLQFQKKERVGKYTELLPPPGKPFAGIVAHIKEKYGGNPMVAGAVVVRCNTALTDGSLEKLFDYDWTGLVATANTKNSWYCIDMKKYKVGLTAYTLKSRPSDRNDPIEWIVEGSNDNSTWKELDNRKSDVLRPSNAVHTFELKKTLYITPYKYIRFRQPGHNSGGSDFFNLTNIELFGRLYEPNEE